MKITSLKNIRISAIRNLFTLRNLGLFLIIAGLLVLSRPIYQWGCSLPSEEGLGHAA